MLRLMTFSGYRTVPVNRLHYCIQKITLFFEKELVVVFHLKMVGVYSIGKYYFDIKT